MKTIKRNWLYESDNTDTLQGEALFTVTGQWATGQLAYSMLDTNGKIIPEHDTSFVQIRYNNKLTMVRI